MLRARGGSCRARKRTPSLPNVAARSCRVYVVIKPIRWIETYRRSALAEREDQSAFDQMTAEIEAAAVEDKMDAAQAWFDRRVGDRPLSRAYNELLPEASTTAEGRAHVARLFALDRAVGAKVLENTAHLLGVTLPIPPEHLAALTLAIGNGIGLQNGVDPDSVPSSLFADGLAYLWLGVMASVDVPEVNLRRQNR